MIVLVAMGLILVGMVMMISKARREAGQGFVVLGLIAMGFGLFGASPEDKAARDAGWQSAAEQAAAERAGVTDPAAWAAQKAAKQAEAAAEERRKGFHCLSKWDGAHGAFRDAVRDMMREPDSFEVIETRITPVDDAGFHDLYMRYRARNGFGGMAVGLAQGRIANDGCGFEVINVE